MIRRETPRLVLCEFDQNDWTAIHAYASDPQVVQFMGWGPNTEEETREHLQKTLIRQRQATHELYAWAVVLKKETQLIGSVVLRLYEPQNHSGSLGYVFNRHYWGHEYATEASREVLAFGFEELDLHRIVATCDSRNIASRRVLEKIGMRCEGHLREHMWQKGRWRDSLMFAILEREWTSSVNDQTKLMTEKK